MPYSGLIRRFQVFRANISNNVFNLPDYLLSSTSSDLTEDVFDNFTVFEIPVERLPIEAGINMSEEAVLIRAHYSQQQTEHNATSANTRAK